MMRIRIKDKSLCEDCNRKTCSVNDVVEKGDFVGLKTEQFTCPTRYLQMGMTNEQISEGFVDSKTKADSTNNQCIYCNLCVSQCLFDNLELLDYTYSTEDDFKPLMSGKDKESEKPKFNSMCMSYLNCLYSFAANTNTKKYIRLMDIYVLRME